MIFSADLVQRLDDGVPCRLPPTYVGVRRVRDNNAVMIQRVTPPALFERDYDCHRNNLDDQLKKLRATNDGGVVSDCVTACDPRQVVGRDVREDYSSVSPTTSSPTSSSATTATAGICYMINGRRMTKAEKREMKHKLKLEAHSVRKEAKARDVKERIRKEKAAKAERRLHKAQEKRRQRVQQQCDETTKFNNNNDLLLPSAATELLSDIVIHHNDDNKDEKKGSSSNLLTENTTSNNDATSNSSSVRKDYLPAMLTPAATRVAQELGILLLPLDDDHNPASYRTTTSSATTTMMTTTIMDPILSARWANALQQSMIPIEMAREKEDIRPLAYRLVPETWRRLCPNTLWIPPAKTIAITSCNDGKSDSNMTSSLSSSSSSSSHVRIRNSSSSSSTTTTYDDDTYAIVSHLHNHSNIHITCGASFGCDYLLYDGRRTERHSFAGLRVYHCCGGVKKKNGTTITNTNGNDGSDDFELPMPSAYDMTGFVRTMNTARKIALIAMVVTTTIEDDNNNTGNKDDKEEEEDAITIMTPRNNTTTVRRIAIVDLALEKVLTAHAHIRKGNTAKRRTEEDAACGLAKKR